MPKEVKAKVDVPKFNKQSWRNVLEIKLAEARDQVKRALDNVVLKSTAGDDEVYRALDEVDGAIENARVALARTRY